MIIRILQRTLTRWSLPLHALRVLRTHGLSDAALQEVYRSVVVARLLYAASAWHGFTKAADRRRINLLFERAKRYSYCMPDLPTFEELCDTGDDQLFNKTVSDSSQRRRDRENNECRRTVGQTQTQTVQDANKQTLVCDVIR